MKNFSPKKGFPFQKHTSPYIDIGMEIVALQYMHLAHKIKLGTHIGHKKTFSRPEVTDFS